MITMAGVTIIGNYSKEEIQEIKDFYEPLGFTVNRVNDMKEAVNRTMDTINNWK